MDTPDKLLEQWFSHPNWWFSATELDDKMIIQEFGHLITADLSSWQNSPKNHLAKIIVQDQIVRHYYRNQPEQYNLHNCFALKNAKEAIKFGYDEKYTPTERCFMLLPFRHSLDKSLIQYTLNKIKYYETTYGSDPMYNRFRLASLKSLAKINNNLTITTSDITIDDNATLSYSTFIACVIILVFFNQWCLWLITLILLADRKSCALLYFIGSDFWRNKSFKVWTKDYYFCDTKDVIFKTIRQTILTLQKDKKIQREILVSLSGGVDSMCLLSGLITMRRFNQIDRVVALHINYGNTYKSRFEEQLVREYCRYHEVPLYIRRIDEVKRNRQHDRDIYEKFTHDIRFDLYRLIGLPVVLGHNHDDQIENVFTNIRKKMHYDNLFGMTTFSINDGVTLIRPLLTNYKHQIYNCARQNGIVHTRNSTPNWCDRGKIRTILIPFLNKFDPGLEKGLENLSQHLVDMSQMIDLQVTQILKNATYNTDSVIIEYDNLFTNFIWHKLIIDICHQQKWTVPSSNSMDNFSKMVTKTTKIKLSEQLWARVYQDEVHLNYDTSTKKHIRFTLP